MFLLVKSQVLLGADKSWSLWWSWSYWWSSWSWSWWSEWLFSHLPDKKLAATKPSFWIFLAAAIFIFSFPVAIEIIVKNADQQKLSNLDDSSPSCILMENVFLSSLLLFFKCSSTSFSSHGQVLAFLLMFKHLLFFKCWSTSCFSKLCSFSIIS